MTTEATGDQAQGESHKPQAQAPRNAGLALRSIKTIANHFGAPACRQWAQRRQVAALRPGGGAELSAILEFHREGLLGLSFSRPIFMDSTPRFPKVFKTGGAAKP